MERVLSHKLYQYLKEHNVLYAAQHGFVKGRSTCSNLLESLNDWTSNLQSKQQTTVIYIDFSKAFDTVSHSKLFARLHSYGIRGTLLLWLERFFTDRKHQTKVGSLLSDAENLISGIVQGSGIGPLMFLIFINELIEVLQQYSIKVKLFADDVKLYGRVLNDIDNVKLQSALDALVEWANSWQLIISIEKCCVMSIGNSNFTSKFNIDGKTLPIVTECRDLGVVMTQSLFPSTHIDTMVVKAHQRANLIHRSFVSRNTSLLVRAYLVYVRPLLEFNSVIWSPWLKQDIDKIERVQRCFTKRLPGFKNLSYSNRLVQLNLPTLELRRLHADLIMCYKLVFGCVECKFSDFFTLNSSTVTRGHMYKLYRPKYHNQNNVRRFFFTERIVNSWNFLPADIVNFTSLSSFKRTILDVDFSRFLHVF